MPPRFVTYSLLKKAAAGFAGLAVAAHALFAPLQAAHAETPPEPSKAGQTAGQEAPYDATLALKLARSKGQFVYFGDTDHRDLSILRYMSQERTMRAFEIQGIKHLFIERPKLLQFIADRLENGALSREQFVKEMMMRMDLLHVKNADEAKRFHEQTADLILNAHKHGIKIHFADEEGSDAHTLFMPQSSFLRQVNDRAIADFEKEIKKHPEILDLPADQRDDFMRNFGRTWKMSNLSPDECKKYDDALTKERFGRDENTADFILKQAGSEKSVIFYGGEHMNVSLTTTFMQKFGENAERFALFGRNADVEREDYRDFDPIEIPQEGVSPEPARPSAPQQRQVATFAPNDK